MGIIFSSAVTAVEKVVPSGAKAPNKEKIQHEEVEIMSVLGQ